MSEKKLGQESAFMNLHFNGANKYEYDGGMSKRFYAACAAMQGLLAQAQERYPQHGDMEVWNYESISKCAFMAADELLKQETNE